LTKAPDPPQRAPPQKACPTCGKPLVLGEKGGRPVLYCPDCDGPDPLHSPKAIGWTKSSLRPPKRPQQ
jgi:uncharacterized Zn finger protein (UPF0148 family)